MTTNIGDFFCFSTRSVLAGSEELHLPVFGDFKGIYQTDTLIGCVPVRCGVKLVFNVEISDVVRQEHDLIALELWRIRRIFPL